MRARRGGHPYPASEASPAAAGGGAAASVRVGTVAELAAVGALAGPLRALVGGGALAVGSVVGGKGHTVVRRAE